MTTLVVVSLAVVGLTLFALGFRQWWKDVMSGESVL